MYENNPWEDLGWYKKPFDRSQNLSAPKNSAHLTFIADHRVSDEQLKNCRYIRVKNIYVAIDAFREHVVSSINPIVVGITGSVAKPLANSF